jgi:hypothetical protein
MSIRIRWPQFIAALGGAAAWPRAARAALRLRRSIAFGFCALTFRDGRISARLAPDHLRRLAVGAEKGTSHSVAIPESGLLRDNVNDVVGVFQQRARPLQAEVLDRPRWCLAGFGLEGAAELAW